MTIRPRETRLPVPLFCWCLRFCVFGIQPGSCRSPGTRNGKSSKAFYPQRDSPSKSKSNGNPLVKDYRCYLANQMAGKDQFPAGKTVLPSLMVSTTLMLIILVEAILSGFWLRITKSASFPGSSVPFEASSKC